MSSATRAEPGAAGLIAAAAAFALAELAAGLVVGRFFDWGRAEALLFLAFRPWLLLAAALAARRWPVRARMGFYALALLLAGLAESALLSALGGEPWLEMLRGWAAGAILVALFDLTLQLGGRIGRAGTAAAAILLFLFLFLPGALRPYEQLALGPTGPAASRERPDLLVMTSLPLIWGEGGAFDPASRPAAAWKALEAEFAPRPIDYVDADALAGGRLMLIAQPRLMAPEELVALDDWVRRGGRLLVLADPALEWPSALAVGDARRPASSSLIGPLLSHWGIELVAPERATVVVEDVETGRGRRRLRLPSPGRLGSGSGRCAAEAAFVLRCRIGAGEAIIVADADLLHDSSWTGPGSRGDHRHLRLADNPLAVADWLDRLAGVERERALRPVRWLQRRDGTGLALGLAMLPILAALVAAGAFAWRRRPNSRPYPQGQGRTEAERKP